MKRVNEQHKESLSTAEKISLFITNKIGTFECAIIFAVIGIMAIYGAWTNNLQLTLIIGSVSGYFLQLVLLPIIMLAQNLESRHSELLAEENYQLSQEIHEHIDRIIDKLNKKNN